MNVKTEQTPTALGRGFIERVTAGPVLVDAARVEEFAGYLAALTQHERFAESMERLDADFWPTDPDDYMHRLRPYNVVDGVLQIPVMGALINRMGYAFGSWATGYTYIEKAFERGLEDPAVRGIAFIIDSPGGEAAGNFELVDKLYEGRGEKPIRAFVADAAYSGAYSIASAADEIIVTRSGGTGSVGVVTMHVDMSDRLDQMGVKVTFVIAGKHKVDGNPFEALSAQVKARIQKRIDKIYGVFVSTVARNRDMTEDTVRGTEALIYDAEESVEIEFADRIGAIEEEVAAFAVEVDEDTGEFEMTTKPNTQGKGGNAAEPTGEAPAPDADTIKRDAVAAERKRFGDVLKADAAKGREALANHLLSNTDLDAAAIIATLEVSPAATAETPPADPPDGQQGTQQSVEDAKGRRSHFVEAMDREGGPAVGGGDGAEDEGQDTPAAKAASILGSFHQARGDAPKPKTH